MAERNPALPALGVRLQDLARRLGVTGFWTWWKRELNTLVPAAPRAALARRRMRPVLRFEGDHAILWRPALEEGRAVMVEAARIPLTGDATAAAGQAAFAPMTMTRMAYGGSLAPVRAVISLGPRDVLRKRIVLPAAVEENFRQALAYDLDRHTPFKSDELYFDAAIVGRDSAHGTITIDLAAARRVVVDPLRKQAAGWGVDIAAIVPEPPATASMSRLNLIPPEDRASTSPWARWQFWLPLLLLVAAALAAAIIPVWQKREYAIQMNRVVGQARAQAAVSESLRQELDARVGDFNAVLDRKYAYPSALAVVDTVSKLLPDDTWLTQFELKTVAKGKEATQRELLLRGESANAGRLVQLFEESQYFAQAAPRSPTTKIQPGPGEIFDLGAQLKALPKPASVPLLTVAGAGETTPAMPGAPATPATASAGGPPALVPVTVPPATSSSTSPSTSTPPAAAGSPPPAAKGSGAPATSPSPPPAPAKAPNGAAGGAVSTPAASTVPATAPANPPRPAPATPVTAPSGNAGDAPVPAPPPPPVAAPTPPTAGAAGAAGTPVPIAPRPDRGGGSASPMGSK
jgi:general secretion pathway protein L